MHFKWNSKLEIIKPLKGGGGWFPKEQLNWGGLAPTVKVVWQQTNVSKVVWQQTNVITEKIAMTQKSCQIKLFLKKNDKIKTILANSICIKRL